MTMPTPLVSVVIPTYNHAHFLKEALESVQAQTYAHWEALVVNNYSEDDTGEVVQGFADPRIRLINFRNHGVIAASRNEGIRRSAGQYVAFLDSDDLMVPQKFEKCLSALNQGADLVCHGLTVYPTGPYVTNWQPGPKWRSGFFGLLVFGNCISTSSTIVRKDALESVGGVCEDSKIVRAEDYDLWLRLAKKGYKFEFIRQSLGIYRRHETSQSSDITRWLSATKSTIDRHIEGSAFFRFLLRRLVHAHLYYTAGRASDTQGKFGAALKYYFDSWKRNPLRPKLYLAVAFAIARRLSRCMTTRNLPFKKTKQTD